ncbi:MAG: hypothetical protein ACUVWP_01260 [bacterium]
MLDEEKEGQEEKKGYIKKFIDFLIGVPISSSIIYIITSTPLGFALGLKVGVNFIMPFINAILIYPVYLAYIIKGRFKTAIFTVLIWSIILSVVVILYSYQDPERAGRIIVMGERYKDEMFEWLATGRGIEGDITKFVPQHLLHLSIFSVLCFATGGFCGLIMGSILLNYMNYYVGFLWHSSQSAGIILYGWSIWAIIRVVGYITISIFLSTPLLCKLLKNNWNFRQYSIYLYTGLSLIILDIILKYNLNSLWREMILKYLY